MKLFITLMGRRNALILDSTKPLLKITDRHGTAVNAAGLLLGSIADGSVDFVNPSGDLSLVTGPASSVDNAITRFHLTTGKVIQSSLATLDDSGNINIPSGARYTINSENTPVVYNGSTNGRLIMWSNETQGIGDTLFRQASVNGASRGCLGFSDPFTDGLFTLSGYEGSTRGPHLIGMLESDTTKPLYELWGFKHDEMALAFDTHFGHDGAEGEWIMDHTSAYRITKNLGELRLYSCSGTAGSAPAATKLALRVDTSGNIGIGVDPWPSGVVNYVLEVDGDINLKAGKVFRIAGTELSLSSLGGIPASTLGANSILYAVTAATPAALSVGASRIVGRAATGNIAALGATAVKTILGITWADVNKSTSSIADIATRSHTSLTDIGTTTHANIDLHIGDSTLHFTKAHTLIDSNFHSAAAAGDRGKWLFSNASTGAAEWQSLPATMPPSAHVHAWGDITSGVPATLTNLGTSSGAGFLVRAADNTITVDTSTYSVSGHTHAHNDTTSIQGGTTDEYYHMTNAQINALHPEAHDHDDEYVAKSLFGDLAAATIDDGDILTYSASEAKWLPSHSIDGGMITS